MGAFYDGDDDDDDKFVSANVEQNVTAVEQNSSHSLGYRKGKPLKVNLFYYRIFLLHTTFPLWMAINRKQLVHRVNSTKQADSQQNQSTVLRSITISYLALNRISKARPMHR